MRVNWGSDELFNVSSFCENQASESPWEHSDENGPASSPNPSAQQLSVGPSPGSTSPDDPPPPQL